MIELYRSIIPVSKIINDNAGVHYKAHMGKLDWITNQFNEILTKKEKAPGDFVIPNIKEINALLKDHTFVKIRCEIWRCLNTVFDPQNYAKMFKAPIDLLVHNGYIVDDSWKYVDEISYCGGGRAVWQNRAFRIDGDGLPDELTPEWWRQYSQDYNDVMLRVLIE